MLRRREAPWTGPQRVLQNPLQHGDNAIRVERAALQMSFVLGSPGAKAARGSSASTAIPACFEAGAKFVLAAVAAYVQAALAPAPGLRECIQQRLLSCSSGEAKRVQTWSPLVVRHSRRTHGGDLTSSRAASGFAWETDACAPGKSFRSLLLDAEERAASATRWDVSWSLETTEVIPAANASCCKTLLGRAVYKMIGTSGVICLNALAA